MIKVALKHFIYEHCIDVLFENIFLNFSPAAHDLIRKKIIKDIKDNSNFVHEVREMFGRNVWIEVFDMIRHINNLDNISQPIWQDVFVNLLRENLSKAQSQEYDDMYNARVETIDNIGRLDD